MATLTRYPTAEELARSLGAKKTGTGWMARCPAHEDRHASLSIAESSDGMRVLWKCHANCPQDDVKRALIATGSWPKDVATMEMVTPVRPAVKPVTNRKLVATYQYRDADGTVVHETLRYEPKDFRQRAVLPDGSHEWSLAKVWTVLYRLPELLASDGPVWIVEGEKDADNLAATGAIATTVPMGAGKYRPHYGDWLRGREVRIVPDNDDAGRAGARTIAKALAGIATSVVVVTLPVEGKGADVTDYLAGGATLADLEALVADVAASEAVEAVPDEPKPMTAATGDGMPLTDLGNAERLLRRHGRDLRYVVAWKSWLVWTGTHWERDAGDHEVRRRAVDTILDLTNVASHDYSPDITAAQRTALVKHSERSQSVQRVAAMIDMARSRPGVIVTPDELDRDPRLLNFANVTIDLQSGYVHPPIREDLITKLVRWNGEPAVYDHELPPRSRVWEAFLDRVLPDPEVRSFVQVAIGYSLVGITTERVMMILYGTGRNGKSTFVETVQAAISDYALTVPSSLFLSSKDTRGGGVATPDIASLYRVRLVTSQETPEGGRLDESRVKWITGDDTISARRLYEAPFTFAPTHTVWLSTNHRPVVRTGGEALWDRMRPIPFVERIGDGELVADLKHRLRRELDGVTAWLIRGARRYYAEGLIVPKAVRGATATYREDSDWFGQFVEARCVLAPDAISSAGEVLRAYNAWAAESNERLLNPTSLGNHLRERGMTSYKTGHGARAWRGIGLMKS